MVADADKTYNRQATGEELQNFLLPKFGTDSKEVSNRFMGYLPLCGFYVGYSEMAHAITSSSSRAADHDQPQSSWDRAWCARWPASADHVQADSDDVAFRDRN